MRSSGANRAPLLGCALTITQQLLGAWGYLFAMGGSQRSREDLTWLNHVLSDAETLADI